MIAIISDIHGNFPALQAVISKIERIGCDKIISLGDVAGYYCHINECIQLLRQKKIQNIMGNHDYYLINDQPCPRSTSANELLQYQRSCITKDNLNWLKQSPRKMNCDEMSLVHGGWKDPLEEYLGVIREDYFQNEQGTYFFSGHTHIQSIQKLDKIFHCNPGSVGQPRDNNPKAAFALFDGEAIYSRRVDYDIDEVANAMEDCGFGSYYYIGLYAGKRIGEIR